MAFQSCIVRLLYFLGLFEALLGSPLTGTSRAAGGCLEIGVDYFGDGLGDSFSVRNIWDCMSACKKEANCKFFTFSQTLSQCWLKRSTGTRKTEIDRVSGPKECGDACQTAVFKKSSGKFACGIYLEKGLFWHAALQRCTSLGARLPIMANSQENLDIFSIQPAGTFKGTWEGIWIGAIYNVYSKAYTLYTNEKLPYANWMRGQPDGMNFNEICVQMTPNEKGKWNDIWCNDSRQTTMCEMIL